MRILTNAAFQAFKAILQNQSSPLASIQWCNEPFIHTTKTLWDKIVDILLSFSQRVRLPGSSFRDGVRGICRLPERAKRDLSETVKRVKLELDELWQNQLQETEATAGNGDCGVAESPESLTFRLLTNAISDGDTNTVTTLALYHATCVICLSLIWMASASKRRSQNQLPLYSALPSIPPTIKHHSSCVLQGAEYVQEKYPLCGDSIRILFGVEIVSILADDKSQTTRAKAIINNQEKQRVN